MPQPVGEFTEYESQIVVPYSGDRVVRGLGDVGIPDPDEHHYTDDRTGYSRAVDGLMTSFGKPVVVSHDNRKPDDPLKTLDDVSRFCRVVDDEYEQTVTRRLQK